MSADCRLYVFGGLSVGGLSFICIRRIVGQPITITVIITVYTEFDVCKNRPTECQNIKLDEDQTLKLTDETNEKSFVNVTVIVQVKKLYCYSR